MKFVQADEMLLSKEQLILLITTLLLTTTRTVNGDSDYSKKFAQYTESWTKISQEGLDGIEKIRKLAGHADSILILGGPIGNFIAAGVKVAFKPKSAEEKDLQELKDTIQQQHKDITRNLLEGFQLIHEAQIKLSYSQNVQSRIDTMEIQYNIMMRNATTMPTKLPVFHQACMIFSPEVTLNRMGEFYKENCPIPTEGQVALFVSANKVLSRMESQLIDSGPLVEERYQRVKTAFVIGITRARKMLAYSTLDDLSQQKPHSLHELTASLLSTPFVEDQGGCLLHMVYYSSEGKRMALDHALLELEQELKAMVLYSSACLNITENGEEEGMEATRTRIANKIKSICEHAAKWTEKAYESAWPLLPMRVASEKLEKEASSSLRESAIMVQRIFEEHGPKRFEYQVLAHDHLVEDVAYAVYTAANDTCASISNVAGLDFHILRFDFEKDSFCKKAANAWERLQQKENELQAAFLKSEDSAHAGAIMRGMIKPLGLVDEGGFAAAFLVRNERFKCSWATIPITNVTLEACSSNNKQVHSKEYVHNHWPPVDCFYRNLIFVV